MKNRMPLLELVALFVLLLAGAAPSQEVIRGRCVGVTDGDTIKVLVTENQLLRIRLSWIDAPERSQAFGQRSKQNLSNLVFGRDVELPTHGLDRYGRILAVIFVDGVDANLEELRSGMAWVFERYVSQTPADIQTSYRQAEVEAREQRRGLWSNPEQIPPWEWRKSEKERSKIGAGRVLIE